MKVVKVKTNNFCAMPSCQKKAEYVIVSDGGRGEGIFICDKCIKSLYQQTAKYVVPKGIENIIVKANKRRENI